MNHSNNDSDIEEIRNFILSTDELISKSDKAIALLRRELISCPSIETAYIHQEIKKLKAGREEALNVRGELTNQLNTLFENEIDI